jgi:hypothetical protein
MATEQIVPLAPHLIPLPVTMPDPVLIFVMLTEMVLSGGVEAHVIGLSFEENDPKEA